MKNILKSSALLLALLTLLSLFAACDKSTPTGGVASPEGNSPTQEEISPDAPLPSSKEEPASPSAPQQSSDGKDDLLAVNKDNALQKLIEGYTATVSASSLQMTGESSKYEAAAGKGDTVVLPISYTTAKNAEGTFTALLSMGGVEVNTDVYFEGSSAFLKSTDNKSGEYTVTRSSGDTPLNIENTLMPVLNDSLSIQSFENVFTRFCKTDYGIDFSDGIYTLYFYGSYTELSRIFLEDSAYESLLEQEVDEVFPSNTGSLEIYLTEDGYFAGLKTGTELNSESRSLKASLSYNFTSIGSALTLDAPDWTAEAK